PLRVAVEFKSSPLTHMGAAAIGSDDQPGMKTITVFQNDAWRITWNHPFNPRTASDLGPGSLRSLTKRLLHLGMVEIQETGSIKRRCELIAANKDPPSRRIILPPGYLIGARSREAFVYAPPFGFDDTPGHDPLSPHAVFKRSFTL